MPDVDQGFVEFDRGPSGRPERFCNPLKRIVAETLQDIPAAFDDIRRVQAEGKWLAGYLGYELGYGLVPKMQAMMPENCTGPLLCLGVFDHPQSAENDQSHIVEGRQDWAWVTPPEPVWTYETYARGFARVKDYISAGDIYQANLTFPMTGQITGSLRGFYNTLKATQPVPCGAYVDLGVGPILLSRSPELFFNVDDNRRIETKPMKGTINRSVDPAEDARLRAYLSTDPKNRAENLMIVDLLRNDISRVSEVGSVRVPDLFSVETYTTVHQMTSVIQGQLLPQVQLPEILQALFPCGSITGAPKQRAMQILREIEPNPRDIYCGAIGWVAPDGRMSFSVAIRTLSVFDGGRVQMNVGGGIVYDSTPEAEYEEALWKSRYATLRLKA